MKKSYIMSLPDKHLLTEFRLAAIKYEEGMTSHDAGMSTKAHKILAQIRDNLKERGTEARLILRPLMQDPEPAVRYFAAHNLLAVLPDEARAVIQAIADEWYGGPDITIYARDTLENLDSGFYTPS